MEDGQYLSFRLGYICILSSTCGAFSKIIIKICPYPGKSHLISVLKKESLGGHI